MPMREYADTSAYLCALLGEAGSPEFVRALAGARILSSVVLALEVERTLLRLSREGRISASQGQDLRERFREDLRQFGLRDVSLDLCMNSVIPAITTPRSLDLLHLRTAVEFHQEEPLDLFLTNDEQQRVSARELGLPV